MERSWTHVGLRVALDGDVDLLVDGLLPEGASIRHQFQPQGYSLVRIGADGTIVVHTWPEWGVATVDGYGAASADLARRLEALGWVVLE